MLKSYNKIMIAVFAALIFFILMFVSLFAVLGSVLRPFEMVGDMIENIGNFNVSDDSYTNDVFIVVDQYFQYGEGYEMLAREYKPTILKHEELIYVPDNYLFIPNILAGNEFPDVSLVEQMHSLAYEKWIEKEYLYDEDGQPILDEITGEHLYKEVEKAELIPLIDYANRIKSIPPFAEKLSVITSSTLVNYIEHFGYIAGAPGLDLEYISLYGANGWIYPFTAFQPITAGVGYYDPFGKIERHNGVDFGASCGTTIYSVCSGSVESYGYNSLRGNYVDIRSDEGLLIHYFHLQSGFVGTKGQRVDIGDYIGYVGTTGKSTGCHLHLGVESSGTYMDYCSIVSCSNPPLP